MRIGFASNDWAMKALDDEGKPTWGGSGWARCGLPAKYLAAKGGHEVTVGTLVARNSDGVLGVRDWDGQHHYGFDVLVLQRYMFATVAVETEATKRAGTVVVNDVDDWFWGLDPANVAYWTTDPRKNPRENRDHYRKVVAASSAVTVSTPYLRDRLRKMFGPDLPIHVLENRVEVDRFAEVFFANTLGRDDLASQGRHPRVGWVGATSWRSGDLETLRGVLGPFLERHDLRAYHGGHWEGASTFAELAGVPAERVDVRLMAPIPQYPSLFEGLGIGLVPLSDRPFNHAKSWIKGLEYAAAGVPFIAQALPEYVRLKAAGVGQVARKPKDWIARLERLLDPGHRLAEAEANLAGVKAFDMAQGWTAWEDFYGGLLNRG